MQESAYVRQLADYGETKGGELYMGALDDVGQKLKGKAQQLKGDFNQERGQGLKGGIQKLKGKVNETVADAKLNARKDRDLDDRDDNL